MRRIVKDMLARAPVVVMSPERCPGRLGRVIIALAGTSPPWPRAPTSGRPTGQNGQERIEKTMSHKVVNDMVARRKSIAAHRDRDPQWVERRSMEHLRHRNRGIEKNVST